MKTYTIKTVHNDKIGESYTQIDHQSGVRVYIIPKDFSTTYVVAGVYCGALDNSFYENGKDIIDEFREADEAEKEEK